MAGYPQKGRVTETLFFLFHHGDKFGRNDIFAWESFPSKLGRMKTHNLLHTRHQCSDAIEEVYLYLTDHFPSSFIIKYVMYTNITGHMSSY